MDSALREFDLGENDISLDDQVSTIEAMADELSEEEIARLWTVLAGRAEAGVDYGPEFDMGKEVEMQILAVRAMRNSIMPGGIVRPGTPAREVKEVVTASSTLLTTLLKTHEKIMSYDRQRAIEEATVEVIKTLPDEQRDQFFKLLEESLSAIG